MSIIGTVFGHGGQVTPPQRNEPAADPAPPPSEGPAAAPPVEGPAATDGGNASGGAAPSSGGDVAAGGRTRPDPVTPYVAEPAVSPDAVEKAADVKARLEAAFAPDLDADRARAFAEAAGERAAYERLIASIQPAPERAPSIREGAEDIRAGQRASDRPGAEARL